jgi:hypothetical protein
VRAGVLAACVLVVYRGEAEAEAGVRRGQRQGTLHKLYIICIYIYNIYIYFYLFIYAYTHIYIYIYIYMYICIHIYVCRYTYITRSKHIRTYIYIHVNTYGSSYGQESHFCCRDFSLPQTVSLWLCLCLSQVLPVGRCVPWVLVCPLSFLFNWSLPLSFCSTVPFERKCHKQESQRMHSQ